MPVHRPHTSSYLLATLLALAACVVDLDDAADPDDDLVADVPLTIAASADTYVDEAAPTREFGGSSQARINGGAEPDQITYLKFPVSGLAGKTVTAAHIRYYVSSGSQSGPEARTTSTGWSESVTWNGRPAASSTVLSRAGSIAQGGAWYTLDVRAAIQGDGTYAFALTPTSTDGAVLGTREGGRAAQLVISTSSTTLAAPTGLSAPTPTASAPALTWNASTGASSYLVFRDGAQVGSTSTTSFSDAAAPRPGGTVGRERLAPGTSAIPTGGYVFITSSDLAGTITSTSKIVKMLSRSYVRGIGLHVSWRDLAPSSSVPYGDPAVLGTLLNKIATAEQLAGRTPIPVFLKFFPTDLPGWLTTPNPTTTPTCRTNALGMKVVAESDRNFYGGTTDMPYSTDPIYRDAIRRLLTTIDGALATYDPNAVRVTMLNFMAPFMSSVQMSVAYSPPEGFGVSGTDPLCKIWTKAEHIAVLRSFGAEMAARPQFAKRPWMFDFTNSGLYKVTEQAAVKDAVAAAHPAGPTAVASKSESLTVNFVDTAGNVQDVWRDQYLDASSWFAAQYVASQPAHAWELWVPFAEGNLSAKGWAAVPQAEWPELMENSMYEDLASANPTQLQRTLFFEVWARDLVAPTSALSSFLTTWDQAIRANTASASSSSLAYDYQVRAVGSTGLTSPLSAPFRVVVTD